jgi:hypothetical protein
MCQGRPRSGLAVHMLSSFDASYDNHFFDAFNSRHSTSYRLCSAQTYDLSVEAGWYVRPMLLGIACFDQVLQQQGLKDINTIHALRNKRRPRLMFILFLNHL